MKKVIYCIFSLVFVFAVGSSTHAGGYVIGEEDMLQISVWGNPELSVHVPVRPDGMISMPLIGDIKAAGTTPQELKKALEKELSRFVKAPVISVMLTAVNSFKVYVFGDGISRGAGAGGASTAGGVTAANPSSTGAITLRRDTTLLQLLAQLGSLRDVDLPNAYLMRDKKKLPVNFQNLLEKSEVSQDVPLEANDVIYLPGGFGSRIRVLGAVRTPGVIAYSEGMTALDAVLSAGGFTEFASQNSVLVVRKDGNIIQNFKVRLKDVMNGDLKKNFSLKPGDMITVKTSLF